MSKTAANIKILNLDTLPTKSPKRAITLGGVAYDVQEMSVEDFIETNLAAERLEADNNPKTQMAEMVASVRRAVPTVPEAELNKLPLEKLGILVAFIRGIFDPDKTDVEGAHGAAGENAEKK
jgi:hypothetical protein